MTALTVLQNCRTIQLTRGLNTLIDEADWPIVGVHRWYAYGKQPWTYAGRSLRRAGIRSQIRMHRILCPGGMVDHRNHDTLDNRRANLRPCTHAENMRNRLPWGASKYKGVCRLKDNLGWETILKRDGKLVRIGRFQDEREAARAYDRVVIAEHGEFAVTNAGLYGDF